jgi:hypothetical protein
MFCLVEGGSERDEEKGKATYAVHARKSRVQSGEEVEKGGVETGCCSLAGA